MHHMKSGQTTVSIAIRVDITTTIKILLTRCAAVYIATRGGPKKQLLPLSSSKWSDWVIIGLVFKADGESCHSSTRAHTYVRMLICNGRSYNSGECNWTPVLTPTPGQYLPCGSLCVCNQLLHISSNTARLHIQSPIHTAPDSWHTKLEKQLSPLKSPVITKMVGQVV